MKQLYYGPLWPLGHVAVDYRGAGENIMASVPGLAETTEYYEAAAKGLIISPGRRSGNVYAINTGAIYLCMQAPDGTFDAKNYPETVIALIPPYSPMVSIPFDLGSGNKIAMSELGLDVDEDGDGAFITGIM